MGYGVIGRGMRRGVIVAAAGLALLAMPAAPTAAAAEPAKAPAATTGPADAVLHAPTMFPKGMWTLEFDAAYYHALADDEDIYSGYAGVGYFFDRKHEVRAEFLGQYMYEEGDSPDADDAAAFGANLGLRYHFYEYERLSLFIEGIAGFFYANRNFPQGGTHFNFNEQLGLGATFRLYDNAHVIGGVRYMHISNARIRGEDENPGFDGLGGFVGMLFTF
jgi:hypothetical protein